MSRRTLAPISILILAAIAWAALPTPGVAQPPAAQIARYIVELEGPAPAALQQSDEAQTAAPQQVAAAQGRALTAIAAAIGEPVAPEHIYRHALNGFALSLTPAQAAAVASVAGVAQVQREWFDTPQTDASPAFIGAAQADLRPALFHATLAGDETVPPVSTAATGRAIAHYDASSRALSFQIFYRGLGGPPSAAVIGQGAPGETGALVLNLAGSAVGASAADGGYIATITLDAGAETSLFAGQLFISIATDEQPGGELRGQLAPSRGEGIVIGVIDTGIDPEHPSFQDPAPDDGYDHRNPRGAGSYLGVCSPDDGDGRYDPTFPCNDKLIGAYAFDETSSVPDPQGRPSPRDNHGHGSHVAGTAAGNIVSGAVVSGLNLGRIGGVAPHANLIVYDVCGIPTNSRSCPSTAILAAIDQAIADGVDVISYSLGGESRNPWIFADAQALLRAVDAGAFVAVAAGNTGTAGAGTINAPANAPWVAGVGAITDGQRPAGSDPDVLYDYSSLGPDRSVPDLFKPDMVAPGVNIVAAGANVNAAAPDFTMLTGTSMATPHVSGLAALLRQIHPDWSPAEIRSAMMLTAAAVRSESGAAAGPFEQGAGRIAARRAALAGFVLDERGASYRAANPATGGTVASLNLPGWTDASCIGGCTFTRTLRSTLGVPVAWEITTSGDGLALATEPAGQLTLQPGATATISVSTTAARVSPGDYAFGSVSFTARGGLAPPAVLPVAMPLDSSNLPSQIAIKARWVYGSERLPLKAITITDFAVRSYGLIRLEPRVLSLAEDPTPEDLNDVAAGGLYWRQLTLPAGNARFRVQIDRSTALDADLFIYVDAPGAGSGSFGPEDQVLCRGTTPSSEEICDIAAEDLLIGREQATQVTILVQNYRGSGAPLDSLWLRWGLVSANPADWPGNLTLSGPARVPAGKPFDLILAWSLPDAEAGDIYIGVLGLGSSPAAPADLGTSLVTLELEPYRTWLALVQR